MRLSRLAWAAALALLLVAVLAVNAPARLLGLVVPAEQVRLQGLEGTVWSGSAARAMLRLPQGYIHLGKVRWTLQPLSLLLFSPRLTIDSEWGGQVLSGDVTLRGTGSLQVRDFDARVSADLVRQFAPLAIDGRLSAQIAALSLVDGLPRRAEGRVVWEDGGFLSPRGRIPLGTYALEFLQPPGEALRGEVVTVAGPLEAEGEVALDGRSYRIDLLLGSEETLDRQLRDALALMATPEGGDYRLELDGDF